LLVVLFGDVGLFLHPLFLFKVYIMRGIINQEIFKGLKANHSETKIKNTLKKLHNITITKEVFQYRYNAIKSKLGEFLPKVVKSSRKNNKRK